GAFARASVLGASTTAAAPGGGADLSARSDASRSTRRFRIRLAMTAYSPVWVGGCSVPGSVRDPSPPQLRDDALDRLVGPGALLLRLGVAAALAGQVVQAQQGIAVRPAEGPLVDGQAVTTHEPPSPSAKSDYGRRIAPA